MSIIILTDLWQAWMTKRNIECFPEVMPTDALAAKPEKIAPNCDSEWFMKTFRFYEFSRNRNHRISTTNIGHPNIS